MASQEPSPPPSETVSFSKAYCIPFNAVKPYPLFHTPETRTQACSMSLFEQEGAQVFTHSIADSGSFIDALFPLDSIFQGPDSSLESFLTLLVDEKRELFNSNGKATWREWDIFAKLTQRDQEHTVAKFFESIAHQAEEYWLTMSSSRRIWSAANKDQPARGGDANRKPDLVCIDPAVGVEDDWRHFLAVGEIKSGECSERQVYLLLRERAGMIFRLQDSRRFVLAFALVKQQMTIALFDRGGSVVSEPFNVLDNPLLLLKVILGLSFSPDSFLGRDHTIITKASIRMISSRYLNNVVIHCTLFIADRMDGRGTVVWLGKLEGAPSTLRLPQLLRLYFNWLTSPPPYASIPLVIKDTWVDEKNSVTEGMILALLNHKGVKGVPRIVAEEPVLPPLPAKWEEDTPYPSMDGTTLNRSRLRLPVGHLRLNDAARKAAEMPSYDPRVHVRCYTTPYAISIFEFRSGLELLGIIADALTSHCQATVDHDVHTTPPNLSPFRILHRDPSSRNLGMVPQEKSDHVPCKLRTQGEHRGLLYDWGFAAIEEVVDTGSHCPLTVDDAGLDGDVVTEEGNILLPDEKDADCGLCTATPECIDDLTNLVELVRQCMYEECPRLDVTGTRPYMSIEMLYVMLSPNGNEQEHKERSAPTHEIRHDLEAFYMVLISLCLLFERPHQPKDLSQHDRIRHLQPDKTLPKAIVEWLTGQEPFHEYMLRDRFLTFGTRVGLSNKILPCLSPYFLPMSPYLERLRQLIYGDHEWAHGPYTCPRTSPSHGEFLDIIYSAMKAIPETNSDFSKIIPPPPDFYPPISASGVWKGEAFSWKNPVIRSNNAFGYFCESKVPLENVVTPSISATETYTFIHSGPETYQNKCRPLRKTRPSELYPLIPSVLRSSVGNQPRQKKRRTAEPLPSRSMGMTPLLPTAKLRKRREQYPKGRGAAQGRS